MPASCFPVCEDDHVVGSHTHAQTQGSFLLQRRSTCLDRNRFYSTTLSFKWKRRVVDAVWTPLLWLMILRYTFWKPRLLLWAAPSLPEALWEKNFYLCSLSFLNRAWLQPQMAKCLSHFAVDVWSCSKFTVQWWNGKVCTFLHLCSKCMGTLFVKWSLECAQPFLQITLMSPKEVQSLLLQVIRVQQPPPTPLHGSGVSDLKTSQHWGYAVKQKQHFALFSSVTLCLRDEPSC